MLDKDIIEEIEIPAGREVKVDGRMVIAKGKKGEVKRLLFNPKVKIEVKEGNVVVSAKKPTKREKKIVCSFVSHIKNMIRGVEEGHVYKLKICSGHFPMTASSSASEFVVKNFLGEKIPRVLKLKPGVSVKVSGVDVIVEGADLELTSQTAASIEQLMRISNRDRRIFQDGIYLTEKDGIKE
jgi:large subunit ribosomal protein L6